MMRFTSLPTASGFDEMDATGAVYARRNPRAVVVAKSAWRFPINRVLNVLAVALICAVTVACGGGGSGASGNAASTGSGSEGSTATAQSGGTESGELLVTLTDAEGDFASYEVRVLEIRLRSVADDLVSVLPAATVVDFAQLTDVTEFVSLATVPAGNYESIEFELDYSDAQVVLQTEDGTLVEAALQDENGDPLAQMTVPLMLPGDGPVRIRAGVPAALALDFDLDASNTIESFAPALVTVAPVLFADTELDTQREHRLRGLLQSVSVDEAVMSLDLRPFRPRVDAGAGANRGVVRVALADNADYEINGEVFAGSVGLQVLSELAENELVVAHGMIVDGQLSSNYVLAGSSVPGAGQDLVRGVVTAREGNTLVIAGGWLEPGTGAPEFLREIEVPLTDSTRVFARGREGLGIGAVSVGQRIVALGSFDAASDVLDTSDTIVRLLQNQLSGVVRTPDPLVVDLALLNGRRPSRFDFSGTGMSAAQDADPEQYDIDAAGLALETLDADDLVRVRGLVNDFGLASPDFNAETVVELNQGARSAHLGVSWPVPEAMPFLSLAGDRIELDLEEARAILRIRGIPVALGTSLALTSGADPQRYAISVRGEPSIELFASLDLLVQALQRHLDDGDTLRRICVQGQYNDDELAMLKASFLFVQGEQ